VVTFGTCLDPHAAFLVARGPAHLRAAPGRQAEHAARIAHWLDACPEVTEIYHPGLASHPDAAVAERTWQPGRRGAMVAFVVAGGNDRAAPFLRALDLVREATSLSGVETLIRASPTPPSSPTTRRNSTWRIRPGLVRLSVGLEDAAELLTDLDQALKRTAPPPRRHSPSLARSSSVSAPSTRPVPVRGLIGTGTAAPWEDLNRAGP
jgi:cystathionine beta-lyase/cystathionine gamma-synthase